MLTGEQSDTGISQNYDDRARSERQIDERQIEGKEAWIENVILT